MKTNEEILNELHLIKNHKQNTKSRYNVSVNIYCEYNNMDLYELIQEAENEEEKGIRWKHRKLKTRLINYRQYLIENYSSGTVANYLTPILVIYKYYEIETQPLPRINNASLKKTAPITYKDLPDKDVIREALAISSPLMTALILFMSSSGCARAETLSLTIKDYIDATREYHDTNDIYEMIDAMNNMDDVIPTFNVLRLKTNKYYTTYCSHECVKAINSYLLSRSDQLKPESKLFKISNLYVTLNFEKINDELGLGKVGNYIRFRPHMLRKFHASALYNDGMSLDKVNDLQGKAKNKTDSVYFMTNPDDLKTEYINHLSALTMSVEVEKVTIKSPEFVKMENELENKKQEVESMNDRVSALENVIYANPRLVEVVNKFKK